MTGSTASGRVRLAARASNLELGVWPCVAALACLLCGASAHLARAGIDVWPSQGQAIDLAQGSPSCVGDCSGGNAVTIADLITMVNIALGVRAASACPSGLPAGADVTVAVIIQAVNNALSGCGLPAPRTIEVDQYTVAAGATEMVQSNVVIIAHRGVEIMGALLIDDRQGGDVTIIAEDGDIVIGGRILASTASAVAAAALAEEDEGRESQRATAARNASGLGGHAAVGTRPRQVSSPNPRKGASFTFRTIGANRDIVIRRFAVFQSGHGQDAFEESVMSPFSARYQAQSGSDGGDLIFEAPSGAIVLPTDQRQTDPPMFGLGDGGRGANLIVERQFSTDETSLELIGGDGGASGRLLFDASTVRNTPAPSPIRWFDEGRGGRGGRVLGDLSVFGILAPTSTIGELNLRLRELVVQGGRGGDGAVAGGDGGLAAFYAGNQLHRRGDPATALRCYGGDGGDVFPSPMPGVAVRGGNGGSFVALGSNGDNGREGAGESRDGERGGDATGQGGKGGDILAGVEAMDIRAGSGGHVPDTATTIVAEIPFVDMISRRPPEENIKTGAFGVAAGPGGSAALPLCSGCPGGKAGDTGNAYAYGGAGGSVFASHGTAGMGGDTWLVQAQIRGIGEGGADGNPPGKGACPGTAVAEPGHGGNGPTLGPDGTRNLQPVVGGCGPDGAICGADLQCASPTPTPIACTTDPPTSYTVTVRTDYKNDEQRDKETSSMNTYSCSGGRCGYRVITTFEDILYDEHGQIVRDENGKIVYTKRMVEAFSTSFDVPPDAYPHCTPQGMRVSVATGPVVLPFVYDGVVLSTTTITCDGCECIDTMAGVPPSWSCCSISCPPPSPCPGLGPTARQAEDSTPENPRFWVLRAPGNCR